MRRYKSGSRWAFWRWTDVDSKYILRLHLVKTPWFALCVHWINKPDPEPHMHDHPVSFLSIILRGGYRERRCRDGVNHFIEDHNRFNFIRASLSDTHKILHVLPNTVTLCFMGPKIREWGFHTNCGWIHWRDYYA